MIEMFPVALCKLHIPVHSSGVHPDESVVKSCHAINTEGIVKLFASLVGKMIGTSNHFITESFLNALKWRSAGKSTGPQRLADRTLLSDSTGLWVRENWNTFPKRLIKSREKMRHRSISCMSSTKSNVMNLVFFAALVALMCQFVQTYDVISTLTVTVTKTPVKTFSKMFTRVKTVSSFKTKCDYTSTVTTCSNERKLDSQPDILSHYSTPVQ